MTSFVSLVAALLLFCACLTPVVASNPAVAAREKWALILGISRFQDPSIKPLAYSLSSARSLAEVLEDSHSGRFTPGHIRLFVNGAATKYGIEYMALEEWLFKKALPNDLILIYLSTRIALASDNCYYLCAGDSSARDCRSTGISLESFLKEIRMRTQSRRIICVLDTEPLVAHKAKASDTVTLQDIATRTGVSLFAAHQLDRVGLNNANKATVAAGVSPLVRAIVKSIRETQGMATLSGICRYVDSDTQSGREQSTLGSEQSTATQTRRLEFNPIMCLAPDNDLLPCIQIGQPIKSSSLMAELHFGHPVETLALERQDLDQVVNAHRTPAQAVEDDSDDHEKALQSFSQSDFSDYLSRMKKYIQKNWQPPNQLADHSVAATFTISKDGTIADASVTGSSGDGEVDDSALAALRSASPLEPLPPGSPSAVQVRYRFSWRVKSNQ